MGRIRETKTVDCATSIMADITKDIRGEAVTNTVRAKYVALRKDFRNFDRRGLNAGTCYIFLFTFAPASSCLVE